MTKNETNNTFPPIPNLKDSEHSPDDFLKNTIGHSTFENNICYHRAKKLSIDCIKLCKKLMRKKDYVILAPICNQLSRCSSSVLSNLSEGSYYHISTRDRLYRFVISSKELLESISWITLLYELEEITESEYQYLSDQCTTIMKILSKSIETMKRKLNQ